MLSITLFVDADAAEGGDGLSWETAFQDLQDGLSEAETRNGDEVGDNDVDAIWVAEGVYKPSLQMNERDPRSVTFSLLDRVSLYGGFAGTETTLVERDWKTHETVLSGDIGIIGEHSDNAYAVVCNEAEHASIDGVTITHGYGDGSPFMWGIPRGGGIINHDKVYVTNCVITENYAANGGGVYNGAQAQLYLIDSLLTGNETSSCGGAVFWRLVWSGGRVRFSLLGEFGALGRSDFQSRGWPRCH